MIIQAASTQVLANGGLGTRPNPGSVLAPTAAQLQISIAELQQQLRTGATLNDVAAARGLAHDSLIAALKDGIVAMQPQFVRDAAGSDRLDRLAIGLASSPGARLYAPERDHDDRREDRPSHGTNDSDSAVLDNVATLLNMTTDELVSNLLGGSTLRELAAERGIAASMVFEAVKRGLALDTTL